MGNLFAVVVGLFFIGWGALMVWKPYQVSRLHEILDAIGSTTPPSEVEPTEWRVSLTKYVGMFAILAGSFFFFYICVQL